MQIVIYDAFISVVFQDLGNVSHVHDKNTLLIQESCKRLHFFSDDFIPLCSKYLFNPLLLLMASFIDWFILFEIFARYSQPSSFKAEIITASYITISVSHFVVKRPVLSRVRLSQENNYRSTPAEKHQITLKSGHSIPARSFSDISWCFPTIFRWRKQKIYLKAPEKSENFPTGILSRRNNVLTVYEWSTAVNHKLAVANSLYFAHLISIVLWSFLDVLYAYDHKRPKTAWKSNVWLFAVR